MSPTVWVLDLPEFESRIADWLLWLAWSCPVGLRLEVDHYWDVNADSKASANMPHVSVGSALDDLEFLESGLTGRYAGRSAFGYVGSILLASCYPHPIRPFRDQPPGVQAGEDRIVDVSLLRRGCWAALEEIKQVHGVRASMPERVWEVPLGRLFDMRDGTAPTPHQRPLGRDLELKAPAKRPQAGVRALRMACGLRDLGWVDLEPMAPADVRE